VILELDMTVALRPSELFGLRWRDFRYDESLLELRETVYRGKVRNWGKTQKALTHSQELAKLAVALNCGIGSSSLNADVNALERLHMVHSRISWYFGSK
jgi:integrase